MSDRDDRGRPPGPRPEDLARQRMQKLQDQLRQKNPAAPSRPAPPSEADEEEEPLEATSMISVDNLPPEVRRKMTAAAEPPPDKTTALDNSGYQEVGPRRRPPAPPADDERTQIGAGYQPPPQPARRATEYYHEAMAPQPEAEPEPEAEALGDDERTQIGQGYSPPPPERLADNERTVMAPPPQVAAGPKGVLTILMGPNQGQRFLIGDGVTHVGRALDCQVVLGDASASRRHFRIEAERGSYTLIDLGSENGTAVNGQRVSKLLLEQDAQISVGTTLLHFGYANAPPPNLAPPPAKAPAKGSSAKVPAAKAAPPRKETIDAPQPSGGGGKTLLLVIVALVVVGGGVLFTGEKVFGWWNLFGMAPKPPAPAVAAEEPAEEEEATTSDESDEGDETEPTKPTRKDPDETPVVVKPQKDAGSTAKDEPDAGAPAAVADAASEDTSAVAVAEPDAGEDTVAAAEDAGEDTAAVAVADAGAPDAGAAVAGGDKLIEEAKALLAEKRMDEAQAKLTEAVKQGAAPASVQALLQVVVKAKGHAVIVQSLQKSVDAGNFDLALKLAESIPQDSPYASDTAALVAKAKDGVAAKKVAEAKKLQAAGQKDKALALVKAALEVVPGFADAVALEKALGEPAVPTPAGAKREDEVKKAVTELVTAVAKKDDAGAKARLVQAADCGRAALTYKEKCVKDAALVAAGLDALRKALGGAEIATVVEPESVAGNADWGTVPVWSVEVTMKGAPAPVTLLCIDLAKDALRMAWPDGVADKPVASAPTGFDPRRGFKSYNEADFAGAIAFFAKASKDPALTEDEHKRAMGMAGAVKQFQTAYEAGIAATESKNAGAAIGSLTQALSLDGRINGHYKSIIRPRLAAMHAQMAGTAFQSGRTWEAARSARKALSLDKNAAGAEGILKQIDKRADEMLAKAKASASGNKPEAKRLLRDLMLILDGSDPRRGAAKKLLDELEGG